MRSSLLNRLATCLVVAAAMWWAVPAAASVAAPWTAPLPEPLTVTRAFDPPENPYGAGHRGVDLAGVAGQEVRAAGAGTVVYAGPLAGRGVVSIQHPDGLRTTYEPVLASISAGISVALGQVIGTLEAGHLGCPAPACLHWGLRRGDVYLDPLLLLRQGPVRLLPRYGGGEYATGLDATLAMTAGPLAAGALGLLRLARRPHCTRSARTSRQASGGMGGAQVQGHVRRRWPGACHGVVMRGDGLGGRPP